MFRIAFLSMISISHFCVASEWLKKFGFYPKSMSEVAVPEHSAQATEEQQAKLRQKSDQLQTSEQAITTASKAIPSSILRIKIERGPAAPWYRGIDTRNIDKKLFIPYEDLDFNVTDKMLTIGYEADNTIDYFSSQGLDDLLQVLPYFGYDTLDRKVTGPKLSYEENAFERAIDKTKQHYANRSADVIQQSFLWAQKLPVQREFSDIFIDFYVDALLKTDFITNTNRAKYYLPLTVDLDKMVTKKLVAMILKKYFSDKDKNFDVHEWAGLENFSFKKALIKEYEKHLTLFATSDTASLLSTFLDKRSLDVAKTLQTPARGGQAP